MSFLWWKADIEVDPIGKGKFMYSVSCQNIECVTMRGYRTSKEKAVEDWNTRKPMERIVERLEELEEEYMYPDDDDYIVGEYDGIREALTVVLEEGGLNDQ